MGTEPKLLAPPDRLYRVGRPPDPFRKRKAPDPLDSTASIALGGDRWDDPAGEYPTVYAGSDRITVLAETLAPFRFVPGLEDKIKLATDESEPDVVAEPEWVRDQGTVPPGYFGRSIAAVEVDAGALFIDIDHPATHGVLNEQLRHVLAGLGIASHYDRGVLMSQDRRLTRTVARFLYENYAGAVVGLRYESRLAAGLECWALWPPAGGLIGPADLTPLSPEDSDVQIAAGLIGVELPEIDAVTPREWADRV